jgi:hypothetical protein
MVPVSLVVQLLHKCSSPVCFCLSNIMYWISYPFFWPTYCPIAFVYFGLLPVDSESPEAKALIPYAFGVLDALEIKYGATHCEIMMTETGPCLVVREVS